MAEPSKTEEPQQRLQVGDLLKELDKTRREGYAYTERTVNQRTGVIAVEMPTPPSQPPMALGIGGAVEMLQRENDGFLDLLQQTLQPYRARALRSKT